MVPGQKALLKLPKAQPGSFSLTWGCCCGTLSTSSPCWALLYGLVMPTTAAEASHTSHVLAILWGAHTTASSMAPRLPPIRPAHLGVASWNRLQG